MSDLLPGDHRAPRVIVNIILSPIIELDLFRTSHGGHRYSSCDNVPLNSGTVWDQYT